MEESKKCLGGSCKRKGEDLSMDNFYKDKTKPDRHSGICKQCAKDTHKAWRSRPESTYNEYNKQYLQRKRDTDVNHRLKVNMTSRVHHGLVSADIYKTHRTIELLGCSYEELKAHLQLQFTEGMAWENYGKGGWEIDHKLPCSSFDLSDIEQQKICFHYTNLQPLWRKDNRAKGGKCVNR